MSSGVLLIVWDASPSGRTRLAYAPSQGRAADVTDGPRRARRQSQPPELHPRRQTLGPPGRRVPGREYAIRGNMAPRNSDMDVRFAMTNGAQKVRDTS